MAENKISYLIEALDKSAPTVNAAKKHVDSLTQSYDTLNAKQKSGSISTAIHAEHTQKLNKLTGDLIDNFIGVGAGIAVFTGLKNAVMDAGLDTSKLSESLGKMSATIGTVLLPEVQTFVDYLVENAETITKVFTSIVTVIKSAFQGVTGVIYGEAALWAKAISYIPGVNKQYWSTFSKEMASNAKVAVVDAWNDVATMGDVKIVSPVKKTDKNTNNKEKKEEKFVDVFEQRAQYVIDTNKFDADKLKIASDLKAQEIEKIKSLESAYNEARINAIENTGKRELDMLALKQSQELELYAGVTGAKQLIDERYAIERKAILDKSSKDAIELSKKEKLAKTGYASDLTNSTFDMLNTISQATKASANTQKTIMIGQALANTALSITKTGAELGYPAAIPFQVIAGITGAAQVANIAKQKFAEGGYVRGIEGGTDTQIVRASAGELFINKRQQSNLMDKINGAGEAVQNMTFNIIDQSGDLIQRVTKKIKLGEADELVKFITNRQLAIQ